MRLKGVWHEIFDLRFFSYYTFTFSWIIVTWAPEYSIGAVSNFFNDTGEQNLLPVTRTRMPWRWGAAKDRRKLKGINRWYLRPPKPYTAANGVIGIAMKSCIQRHSIHLDQRPLRPAKLNITVLVWSNFCGLRGILSSCIECLWMQLFMAIPMTPSAAMSDFIRRKYLRFIPICRKNRPLSSIQFITDEKFIDTGEQFIGGVVDTGDSIFPRCCWYRSEISKKLKFVTGVTAKNLFTGVNDTADKFFDGVSDTGDKTVLPILACVRPRPGPE